MTAGKSEPDVEGLAADLGSYSINDSADGVKREDSHEDERGETAKSEDKSEGKEAGVTEETTKQDVKDEDDASASGKQPVLDNIKTEDETTSERSIRSEDSSPARDYVVINENALHTPATPESEPEHSEDTEEEELPPLDFSPSFWEELNKGLIPFSQVRALAPSPDDLPDHVRRAHSCRSEGLLPPRASPPICWECGSRAKRGITRSTNENGNAGRPFDTCSNKWGHDDGKSKFLAFADDIGNARCHPCCHCEMPGKLVVKNEEKGREEYRRAFLQCRWGECDWGKPAGQVRKEHLPYLRYMRVC